VIWRPTASLETKPTPKKHSAMVWGLKKKKEERISARRGSNQLQRPQERYGLEGFGLWSHGVLFHLGKGGPGQKKKRGKFLMRPSFLPQGLKSRQTARILVRLVKMRGEGAERGQGKRS